MDTLKIKTANSNHVVFSFISILCTSNLCGIYSRHLQQCTVYVSLIKVSMNILLWNCRTNLMNNTRELPEI